jgi:hypothetical protein
MKENHQFNLIRLEKNLNDSYQDFVKSENDKTRSKLFEDIYHMAIAIVTINKYNHIEIKEVANEYSLRLYERIVIGSFRFRSENNHIPFTQYIKLNIRDVVFPNKNNHIDILEDLKKSSTGEDIKTSRKLVVDEIVNILKGLYGKEFDRLLPIALESVCRTLHQPINPKLPRDIYNFTITMIGVAKRLTDDYTEVQNTINLKSSLLLLTLLETDLVPKELILSLDLKSLYRLSTIAGGTKIKIPTLRQLESLINASNATIKVINGEGVIDASEASKKELGLVLSNRTDVVDIIKKVNKIYESIKPDGNTEPLIEALLLSQNALMSHYKSLDDQSKETLKPLIEGQIKKLRSLL